MVARIDQFRLFCLQLGNHLRHKRGVEVGVAFSVNDIGALDEAVFSERLLEAGDRCAQLRMFAEIGDANTDRIGSGRSRSPRQRAGDNQSRKPSPLAHTSLPEFDERYRPPRRRGWMMETVRLLVKQIYIFSSEAQNYIYLYRCDAGVKGT